MIHGCHQLSSQSLFFCLAAVFCIKLQNLHQTNAHTHTHSHVSSFAHFLPTNLHVWQPHTYSHRHKPMMRCLLLVFPVEGGPHLHGEEDTLPRCHLHYHHLGLSSGWVALVDCVYEPSQVGLWHAVFFEVFFVFLFNVFFCGGRKISWEIVKFRAVAKQLDSLFWFQTLLGTHTHKNRFMHYWFDTFGIEKWQFMKTVHKITVTLPGWRWQANKFKLQNVKRKVVKLTRITVGKSRKKPSGFVCVTATVWGEIFWFSEQTSCTKKNNTNTTSRTQGQRMLGPFRKLGLEGLLSSRNTQTGNDSPRNDGTNVR